MKKFLSEFTKFEKIWVSTFTAIIMLTTLWFSYTMTDYMGKELFCEMYNLKC